MKIFVVRRKEIIGCFDYQKTLAVEINFSDLSLSVALDNNMSLIFPDLTKAEMSSVFNQIANLQKRAEGAKA